MANQRTDLMQGTLELLILHTLARESMHGYGIVQRIHEAAEDLLKVEDGSLYPALYRMEERGWIKSEWGVSENNRRAKFYKLTRTGQRKLEAERANWNRISKAITKICRRPNDENRNSELTHALRNVSKLRLRSRRSCTFILKCSNGNLFRRECRPQKQRQRR